MFLLLNQKILKLKHIRDMLSLSSDQEGGGAVAVELSSLDFSALHSPNPIISHLLTSVWQRLQKEKTFTKLPKSHPKTCQEFVLNWSRNHFFLGDEQGPVWEATLGG